MNNLYAVTLDGAIVYITATFREGDGLAIFSDEKIADLYCKYMQSVFELYDYKVVEIECNEVKVKK